MKISTSIILAWKILLNERIMEVKLIGTDCGVEKMEELLKEGEEDWFA